MLSSKKGGIVLPCDVVQEMFIKYCDHDTLCNTRALHSTRVRRCTQFGDMESAIKAGNLENVKWIARQNDEWKKKVFTCLMFAAKCGHLECLKWLFHALGRSCKNDGVLYLMAAEGGHLEICTWLMENGAPLNQRDFHNVVQIGNVQVIKWCVQNGAVFNDMTFYVAARSYNGKIEALEWLKVNNCSWGILSLGIEQQRLLSSDVVDWLKENECPN